MATLTSTETYDINPEDVWRKFKWRADKPRLRAMLRELAGWREKEAQRLNVPRNRVVRDEALMEIASHPPTNIHDLARIRGLGTGFAEGRQGQEVLAAVERANAVPPDQCPTGERRRVLPNGAAAVMDLLKVMLKQVSEEHGVATKLIATTDDLEAIAADDASDVPAMRGWRHELFGIQAVALKKGELALCLKNNRVKIFPLTEKA